MGRQYGTNSISSEEAHAIAEAEHRAKERSRLLMERNIGIVAVVIGLVMLATGIYTKVTGPGRLADLDDQIAAATEVLNDKIQLAENGGNIKYVDPVMNSAKEAGLKVCELQNQLIAFDDAYQLRRRSLPDGSSLDFTDEHKACLAEFQGWLDFNLEGTAVIDKSGNNIWSYYGQWEFLDTFDYAGDDMTVIWVNYAVSDVDKEKPLCFVTAKYSAYYDKFHTMHRYITPEYSALVAADSLRDTAVTGNMDIIPPDDSILPFDQHGDSSIGPPNSMSADDAAQWSGQQNAGQSGSSTEQTGDTGQDGSGVQQWTRPKTGADEDVTLTMGD